MMVSLCRDKEAYLREACDNVSRGSVVRSMALQDLNPLRLSVTPTVDTIRTTAVGFVLQGFLNVFVKP